MCDIFLKVQFCLLFCKYVPSKLQLVDFFTEAYNRVLNSLYLSNVLVMCIQLNVYDAMLNTSLAFLCILYCHIGQGSGRASALVPVYIEQYIPPSISFVCFNSSTLVNITLQVVCRGQSALIFTLAINARSVRTSISFITSS